MPSLDGIVRAAKTYINTSTNSVTISHVSDVVSTQVSPIQETLEKPPATLAPRKSLKLSIPVVESFEDVKTLQKVNTSGLGVMTLPFNSMVDDLAHSAASTQNLLQKWFSTAALYLSATVGFLVNRVSFKLYAAAVETVEYFETLPGKSKSALDFAKELSHILSVKDLRELWFIDVKINIREIIKKIESTLIRSVSLLKRFYLGIFVVLTLVFLALGGVGGAKTQNQSFLKKVVDNSSYTYQSVVTTGSNTAEALLSKNVKNIGSRVQQNLVASHTVTEKQNIKLVSALYGVSEQTIRFNNGIADGAEPTLDQVLFIPATDAYVFVAESDMTKADISRVYKVTEADINDLNPQLANEESVSKGKIAFLPISNFSDIRQLKDAETERVAAETSAKNAAAARSTYVASQARAATLAATSYKVEFSTPSNLSFDGGFIWPTDSNDVSCGFYCYGGHAAIDIQDGSGLHLPPIYASAAGVVESIEYGWGGGYGNNLWINHGNGWKTHYAHLNNITVSAGQSVGKGEQIGRMGNTGRVYGGTGIHLHFEIKKDGSLLNPLTMLP
jgi:murein DD-endopeptidase MepM/ murein hydrolase activator NlpD